MTDNLLGALVLLLAIFPGVLGGRIYHLLVGVDWREKEWQSALRLLGFSIFGATLYSVFASWVHLLPPTHLFPATYITVAADPRLIARLVFLPYTGHLIGGTLAGLGAALATRALARFSSGSAHPCAWDDFIRRYAPGHWVTVGLTNGEAYAGKLLYADVGVASGERDLVLGEPAVYEPGSGNYIATSHQHLFITAANLSSIATYYDPAMDNRTVQPSQLLFTGEANEQKHTAVTGAAESGSRGEGGLPPHHSVAPSVGPATASPADTQAVVLGTEQVKVRVPAKLVGE
jgi:hypothetical protein